MALRESPGPPTGRGDGTITDDGCPVEVYAALPPDGEAEIIHGAAPAGGSVLELGCGTGRIASTPWSWPADYRPSSGPSWTAGPVELELSDLTADGRWVLATAKA